VIEFSTKTQLSERGRKMINRLVKFIANGKRGGKMVDWRIKLVSSFQECERGRKVVNRIDVISQIELSERGG
jgi:hypothetical protein